MFIGEFLCLPAFVIVWLFQRWRNQRSQISAELGPVEAEETRIPRFNPFVFLPAAILDMCGTSIMYVGLNLTNAASFQMLRGAVIIFTGLLSVAFLRSILYPYKWVGMTNVMIGLIIVGLADVLRQTGQDINNVISGDLLIIMAQIIVAVQMVYEQQYVIQYNVPPLLAVGLEGLFGAVILSILLVPFYFIHVPSPFGVGPDFRLEDALDAFAQIHANPLILVALIGTICSIAFFNFAGITMTKEVNATTRMVLDSVRTLVIWVVSLAVSWQQFSYIQVFGFLILLAGMCIYNDILFGPTNVGRFIDNHGLQLGFCRWYYVVPPDAQPLGQNRILSADEDENGLIANEISTG